MQIYSDKLHHKLQILASRKKATQLGGVNFSSALLLAPMASICNSPFRLLMQELGSGGSVSELISCHGINYANDKTLNMLYIDPREENVGIQLFGEDADALSASIEKVLEYGPSFIDINMGCPVKKVVTKGGGSALLKDTKKLSTFLKVIKKNTPIPLTIKIRTGWDDESTNADEVIKVATDSGVEFVAIHGRTRAQGYSGVADWDYLEKLSSVAELPIIGNGDLHTPGKVRARMEVSSTDALMIARGCLRNPFIFLESLAEAEDELHFGACDYLEVLDRFYQLVCERFESEKVRLIQMRKMIVWFSAGFKGAGRFREGVFKGAGLSEIMDLSHQFFMMNETFEKNIDYSKSFMSSGHG
ncbi:MAG: hypothetical protein HOE90_17415 [Bacteriovoracaceae bacterium]|jgi:tRNA-dihydrouridine synthase B|nr:hypothetical protein [Bacteriovoracaceae bacterium]